MNNLLKIFIVLVVGAVLTAYSISVYNKKTAAVMPPAVVEPTPVAPVTPAVPVVPK